MRNKLRKKAFRLHQIVSSGKQEKLNERCCNFRLLEQVCTHDPNQTRIDVQEINATQAQNFEAILAVQQMTTITTSADRTIGMQLFALKERQELCKEPMAHYITIRLDAKIRCNSHPMSWSPACGLRLHWQCAGFLMLLSGQWGNYSAPQREIAQ